MPFHTIPVKRSQKKELENLNEGMLFSKGVVDFSRIEILEMFEDVQMKLADARSSEKDAFAGLPVPGRIRDNGKVQAALGTIHKEGMKAKGKLEGLRDKVPGKAAGNRASENRHL